MRELAFITGSGGAKLAEFRVRKEFDPEKTDEEIWEEINAKEWPEGFYQISSCLDEPYIKYLGTEPV